LRNEEVQKLVDRLKEMEKTAPETRPTSEESTPSVDKTSTPSVDKTSTPSVDSTSSTPTKEQIEDVEKVIAGKLKEKGISEKDFIKTLAKDKPEFKDKKSLSQIVNSFKTSQELTNFKTKSLESIDNQKAESHLAKYK